MSDGSLLHDTSVIMEPVELNINDNNADDYEFSFAAKDTLRRNLTQSFDKHVHSMTSNHRMAQALAGTAGGSKKPPLVPLANSMLSTLANNAATDASSTTADGMIMSKRHLLVYLRVRPPVASTDSGLHSTVEILPPPVIAADSASTLPMTSGCSKTIRTNPPEQSNAAKVERGVKEYLFSGVFGPTATQQDLYRTVAAPLVQGLFPSKTSECVPTTNMEAQQPSKMPSNKSDLSPKAMIGESALLFAYGITNAGKTHTILGNIQSKNQKNWGIVPKSLQDIFSRMETSPNQYDLYLSYFEIYQDQIYDLLPKKAGIRPETLKLRERGEQVVIRGLARHGLRDIPHALSLVHEAHRKRHTSSNNLNRDSSRSHCVCQLELVARQPSATTAAVNEEDNDDASVVTTQSGYTTDDEVRMHNKRQAATLWIVDLAGIERGKRTHVAALRQKEASLINQSLMNLMRCLTLLRANPQQEQRPSNATRSTRIPFRESKLTHLFMNHFLQTGAARTRMIVNINPAAADYDETQHVLHYASQARKVIQLDADATRKLRPLPPSQRYAVPAAAGRRPGKRTTTATTATNTTASTKTWAANAGAAAKQALIQVVRKLSPKRLQAKQQQQQQQQQQHALRKRVAPSNSSISNLGHDSNNNTNNNKSGNDTQPSNNENQLPPTKRIRTKEVEPTTAIANQGETPVLEAAQAAFLADLKRQIQSLETALSVAQAESQVLRYEKQQLEEALDQREEQIRLEVAEEMESQMNAMRQHYEDILQRLVHTTQQQGAISHDDGVAGDEHDGYYDENADQDCEEEEEEEEDEYDDDDDDDTVEAEESAPTPKRERPELPTTITVDEN